MGLELLRYWYSTNTTPVTVFCCTYDTGSVRLCRGVGFEKYYSLPDWWRSVGKVPVLVKYDNMMGRKSAGTI